MSALRWEFRMSRLPCLAFAVVLANYVFAPWAKGSLDIELHFSSAIGGTILNSKTLVLTQANGGSAVADVVAYVSGSNGDPTDEGLEHLAGSFLSSAGGLHTDLSFSVEASFQGQTIWSNGRIQDLDGDGDFDVGA